MPVITLLFSFLARKANDIVQAVFGWSITALFGKLPRRQQVMVTAALVLSLAWPLFVLGIFVPKVAAWAIAFVPLHSEIRTNVLRIIWIALAVTAPIGIGLLVSFASPRRRGGAMRAIVAGYPMAVGFFLAFVLIAVTVPTIKIASLVRRWSDEHVYIQPREGQYDEVVRALAEATERAGHTPRISDAPTYMVMATAIIRWFARGAVTPFVSDTLKRVASDGFEMYLYPGDLLLRGRADVVGHVRAMFPKTKLSEHAYLVGADRAKELQDELTAVDTALDVDRLRTTYVEIMKAEIPYDDWVSLDSLARRCERRLLAAGIVSAKQLPIDTVGDHLETATRAPSRPAELRVTS